MVLGKIALGKIELGKSFWHRFFLDNAFYTLVSEFSDHNFV